MNAHVLAGLGLGLRLTDSPALVAAAARDRRVLPVFIWAAEEEGKWPPGLIKGNAPRT